MEETILQVQEFSVLLDTQIHTATIGRVARFCIFSYNPFHYRDCEWTITVNQGNQIRLNVTKFELEHHHNCNYDYLEIRFVGKQGEEL